ncbi:MAG: STAS domain-containing protein [Verrucomicrobiota bacterium]
MKHELNQNGQLTLIFEEDILSTNVDRLKDQIDKIMELPPIKSGGIQKILFDMKSVKMVDSMGLNLLVNLVKSEKNKNHSIAALVTSLHLHRTLLFTRMDKQMDITLIQ